MDQPRYSPLPRNLKIYVDTVPAIASTAVTVVVADGRYGLPPGRVVMRRRLDLDIGRLDLVEALTVIAAALVDGAEELPGIAP